MTVAAKVIFVSMVFTLLALGRPASSIRAYLCMPSLNSTATDGSPGIHPGRSVARQKAGGAYALLTGISSGPNEVSPGCGVFRLDTPTEQQHLNKS